jgi:hypothetical protein
VRTASEIADDLEKLLTKGRPVPLTDQVRIEKKQADALLAELRRSLEAGRIA